MKKKEEKKKKKPKNDEKDAKERNLKPTKKKKKKKKNKNKNKINGYSSCKQHAGIAMFSQCSTAPFYILGIKTKKKKTKKIK